MTDHLQLRLRYALLKGTERESRFVEEDVREQIMKEYEGKEDGETIVQIFQICFSYHYKKEY